MLLAAAAEAWDLVTYPPHWLAVAAITDELLNADGVGWERVREVIGECLADPGVYEWGSRSWQGGGPRPEGKGHEADAGRGREVIVARPHERAVDR